MIYPKTYKDKFTKILTIFINKDNRFFKESIQYK